MNRGVHGDLEYGESNFDDSTAAAATTAVKNNDEEDNHESGSSGIYTQGSAIRGPIHRH
jgi:hypothetical protein